MSKLSHEIKEARKDIARLENKINLLAKGIAKVMELLEGGIKLTMQPQTGTQPKIWIPGMKITQKGGQP